MARRTSGAVLFASQVPRGGPMLNTPGTTRKREPYRTCSLNETVSGTQPGREGGRGRWPDIPRKMENPTVPMAADTMMVSPRQA